MPKSAPGLQAILGFVNLLDWRLSHVCRSSSYNHPQCRQQTAKQKQKLKLLENPGHSKTNASAKSGRSQSGLPTPQEEPFEEEAPLAICGLAKTELSHGVTCQDKHKKGHITGESFLPCA